MYAHLISLQTLTEGDALIPSTGLQQTGAIPCSLHLKGRRSLAPPLLLLRMRGRRGLKSTKVIIFLKN